MEERAPEVKEELIKVIKLIDDFEMAIINNYTLYSAIE